jgi:putative tributyrin esterase
VHRADAVRSVLAWVAIAGMLAAAPPSLIRPRGPEVGPLPAGGTVAVDTFWSQSLGTRKRLVVWLPPSYGTDPARRYPVAYYLHGAFGNETDWTARAGLDHTLDSLVATGLPEIIVVMPDGDDGWYTTWNVLGDNAGCRRAHARQGSEPADDYCVPWPHYDDYIAHDLVSFVDRRYRTRADRLHRGIAGLSMGGYGAVALALAYPEVFAAAASHSGVLAPLAGSVPPAQGAPRYAAAIDSLRARYPAQLWGIMAPAFGNDTSAWWARDPGRLAARLLHERPSLMPALLIDCGTADPLLEQNRLFRDTMAQLGIPVTYAEWPGAHTWDYWRRHGTESAAWLSRQLTASK